MKRVLVFSFFPAFTPPTSGGELRLFQLYSHLSQFHDITLLSLTYPGPGKGELIEHHAQFRELRVPKDDVFLQLHAKMAAEGIGPECSALVVALAGKEGGTRYHATARQLIPAADVVIHESPYTLHFDSEFNEPNRCVRIYNIYNVKSYLVSKIFSGP